MVVDGESVTVQLLFIISGLPNIILYITEIPLILSISIINLILLELLDYKLFYLLVLNIIKISYERIGFGDRYILGLLLIFINIIKSGKVEVEIVNNH